PYDNRHGKMLYLRDKRGYTVTCTLPQMSVPFGVKEYGESDDLIIELSFHARNSKSPSGDPTKLCLAHRETMSKLREIDDKTKDLLKHSGALAGVVKPVVNMGNGMQSLSQCHMLGSVNMEELNPEIQYTPTVRQSYSESGEVLKHFPERIRVKILREGDTLLKHRSGGLSIPFQDDNIIPQTLEVTASTIATVIPPKMMILPVVALSHVYVSREGTASMTLRLVEAIVMRNAYDKLRK
ncbi:hypothetical protein HDU93_002802, partial [Gonapodya sp. JEL0774]